MGNAMLYEVTNIKTGEKFCGRAIDLAIRFNVTPSHINKLANEGKRIHLDWKIVKAGHISEHEKVNAGYIPSAFAEEWDKVTEPFRKLSIRKKEKACEQKINHA